MGEHLSALALDNLAADLPVDLPASSHVATCAACRAKLDALKAERAALMQTPKFNALLSKLQPAAPPKKLPRWVPVMLAMAAALLVLIGTRFLPLQSDTILKGDPTVELLSANDTAVTTARVGDKLSLAVGGAGQRAVAVFTVDDRGEVGALLPSTAIPAGARVPVGKVFEVTPGSLSVVACFGAHPLAVDTLRAELARRAQTQKRNLSPPAGCAKTMLEVLP